MVRFTADKPGSIALKLTLKRAKDAVCVADPSRPGGLLLRGRIARKDESGADRGLKFAARLLALNQGGTVSSQDGVLTVAGADSVTLLLDGGDRLPRRRPGKARGRPDRGRLRADLCRAPGGACRRFLLVHPARLLDLGSAGPGVEALPTDERLARLKGGQEDPGLIVDYFCFGRYLLLSSSRPGGMPANLQGIWAWQMNPPWNADYHTNINIQMNYWPAEATNLGECALPFFDLMTRMMEPGGHVAQVDYGARAGWCTPDRPLGLRRPRRRPPGHLADGRGVGGPPAVRALPLYRGQEVPGRAGVADHEGGGPLILDFLVVAPEGRRSRGSW